MSTAIVNLGVLSDTDFAPSSEEIEILQNIRTLFATPKYSVPLDREFGVDMSYLDKPMQEAQSLAASEFVTSLRNYEPRAQITQIAWSGSDDGALTPKIEVRIVGS